MMEGKPHHSGLTFFRFALNSVCRKPLRSIVAALGVSIAVATAFSLLSLHRGYTRSLRIELGGIGAHVLIAPKGSPYEVLSLALHGATWPAYLNAVHIEEARGLPGVAVLAPVFMIAFTDSEWGHTVYAGVDSNMLAIKPSWKIEGRFPKTNEILIGSEVARKRKWDLGQTVTLPDFKEARSVVSGVLQPTGSSDDNFIFLPLSEAQQHASHPNEFTHAFLRLGDPNQLNRVMKALRGVDSPISMNVVPLSHLFSNIQSVANSTRWLLGCATLVTLLAAGAGVVSAMLIAIAERAREIGVMRALGASRMDVFCLVWLESVQTCLIGGVLGTLVAFVSMNTVEHWLRSRLPFAPGGEIMSREWQVAVICVAISILLGGIAGCIPAWRVARSTPMEAMRSKDALA